MRYVTAREAGLQACNTCGLVNPPRASGSAARTSETEARCRRCGAPLHVRHPDSVTRTWALLIAAALLYIPANLLPIMHTSSIFGSQDNTIMSGIIYFWQDGEWPLACIVFIASILVPMLKLVVLVLLVVSSQLRSQWRPRQRTRLYRLVEKIGRWSMLDIFVITLTVTLVNFQSLAVITPGSGAVAFACVVVLTMLASMTFDPRLIWDPIEHTGSHYD
jgi:paraquat-inducible protein A